MADNNKAKYLIKHLAHQAKTFRGFNKRHEKSRLSFVGMSLILMLPSIIDSSDRGEM